MAMNQEELQNKLMEAQQLQQQLQNVVQQRQQLQLKENDIERALSELEKLKDDTPVYRNVGENILVKVEEKDKLIEELKDDLESTNVRVKALGRQEDKMRKTFQNIQKELSESIGGINQGA